jgi:hypothetical protein
MVTDIKEPVMQLKSLLNSCFQGFLNPLIGISMPCYAISWRRELKPYIEPIDRGRGSERLALRWLPYIVAVFFSLTAVTHWLLLSERERRLRLQDQ